MLLLAGNSYRDILYSRRPTFYVDGDAQDGEIMDAYLLHVVSCQIFDFVVYKGSTDKIEGN